MGFLGFLLINFSEIMKYSRNVTCLSSPNIGPVCRFFIYFVFSGNRPIWEFGWAYGVGWGAAIFLFGGVVLLLCDKESEEIYYKERKIVHENQMRA